VHTHSKDSRICFCEIGKHWPGGLTMATPSSPLKLSGGSGSLEPASSATQRFPSTETSVLMPFEEIPSLFRCSGSRNESSMSRSDSSAISNGKSRWGPMHLRNEAHKQ
jgi:hypothetical protein